MLNSISKTLDSFNWKTNTPLIGIGAVAVVATVLGVVSILNGNLLSLPASVHGAATKILFGSSGALTVADALTFGALFIKKYREENRSSPVIIPLPPLSPEQEEKLRQKAELVKKAWNNFLKGNGAQMDCHSEVESYFEKTVKALEEEKRDVPLPLWLHATKWKCVGSILTQERLNCSMAPRGFGVFLSDADEYQRYAEGSGMTFVFDHEDVRERDHEWRQSEGAGKHWVSVSSDLTLSSKTVAFVAVNQISDVPREHQPFLTALQIPVVSRNASLCIRTAFNEELAQGAFLTASLDHPIAESASSSFPDWSKIWNFSIVPVANYNPFGPFPT